MTDSRELAERIVELRKTCRMRRPPRGPEECGCPPGSRNCEYLTNHRSPAWMNADKERMTRER